MSKHHRAVIRWKNNLKRQAFGRFILRIRDNICRSLNIPRAVTIYPVWRKPGDHILFGVATSKKRRYHE